MDTERKPKFAVGAIFLSRGKAPRLCTVMNIHTTRDVTGKLVEFEYIALHLFLGQEVRGAYPEASVARGLVNE
ncbi:MAG: hypothetical protein R8K20_03500 [Gallionellaceae bacterium]